MSYLAGLGWVLPGSFRILLLSFLFFFFWVVLATDVASMACKLISFNAHLASDEVCCSHLSDHVSETFLPVTVYAAVSLNHPRPLDPVHHAL